MNRESHRAKSLWRSPLVVVVAASLIALISFGVRSAFGQFLEPITIARDWSRETYALALAIQNLVWGLGVPLASMMADRYGPSRVLAGGATVYCAGIWGMSTTTSTLGLQLFAGVLTGLGIAFTAFSIALAAMARAVGHEQRSLVLGVGTASGSLGQVVFSPLSQLFIGEYGWQPALMMLAASALIILPLACVLPARGAASGKTKVLEQSIGAAVSEAIAHQGYLLLTLGFFVCGFHVAFITIHFPAYVRDLGLSATVGANAIALIGFFNIIGAFLSGLAGQRWKKKSGLAFIYATRALAIAFLMLSAKTSTTVYVFASVMGLLWLSTVPLTSGIVAQVFGVRYMATLYGMVFLGHQLGSFLGVWLGGYLFDRSGSYDIVWWTGVVLSIMAALIHLPINERPLARLAEQSSL